MRKDFEQHIEHIRMSSLYGHDSLRTHFMSVFVVANPVAYREGVGKLSNQITLSTVEHASKISRIYHLCPLFQKYMFIDTV